MRTNSFLVSCCVGIFLLITACDGGGNHTRDAGTGGMTFVSQWNELALAAIRSGVTRPTVISRQLFLLSAAMYDAWAAYDPVAAPYMLDASLHRPKSEHTVSKKKRAVSQAAYAVLVHEFPGYEAETQAFSNHLKKLGYPLNPLVDERTPEGIGILAAQAVLDGRRHDGSNWQNGYTDVSSAIYPVLYQPKNSPDPEDPRSITGEGFDPNRWTPLRVPTGVRVDEDGNPVIDGNDPASYADQIYLTPHWGAVVPFALTAGNQFRPQQPPQRGSFEPYADALGNITTHDAAWNRQFDQVLEFSADLTDAEKVMAEFWADGPRTESPPGHWNQLAHGVAERDRHGIDEDVKMYFALNAAVFDAGIATWESKRYYDCIRPASAIAYKYYDQIILAWGGPDQGTRAIPGQDWRPYQDPTFVTPPFPEYVSGHSTFSRAAAEALTLFTGSPQFFDGVTATSQDVNSDGEPDLLGQHIARAGSNRFENGPARDVILEWWTFEEAAQEAGISRLYGGIHIQDSNLFGLDMGEKIGRLAYEKAASYWNGMAVQND